MKTKLTLALAQVAIANGKPEENLKKAEKLIEQAKKKGTELICFPELWTTGFNWKQNDKLLDASDKIVQHVADLAKRNGIWINGSMLTRHSSGKPQNTSILFNADGKEVGRYGKMHLFSYIKEDEHMVAGDKLSVVDTPWGSVGLAICYDLRFPEMFRTYALKGARLVLLPSAFPHPRLQHWKTLLRARAIEDQLFVAGVNQVGDEDLGDGKPSTYFGDSCVIDPWGETVIAGSETKEELLVTQIDLGRADEVRKKMTVLNDRRPELYDLK